MKYFALIFTLVLSSCTQQSSQQPSTDTDNEIPDIFDIEVGKVVNINGFSKINNGSNLPYAWLLAPLPQNSAVSPSTNYRLNIDKESLIVQSVHVTEPVLASNCEPRISQLKAALTATGYVPFDASPKATEFMRFPYKKGQQLASFSCSTTDGVPFSELQMQITTEAEHEKFENRMRSYGS